MNNNSNGLQICITPTDNASTHTHACRTFPMLLMTQCLGETVRCHILCRDVLYPNNIVLNCIMNKVMTDIDVLGPGMRDWIFGERESTLIVREQVDGIIVSVAQLG